MGLGGAFVDLVAAGDEEFSKVLAAEADVVGLLRGGDDEVHTPGLVADLDAECGGDVEPAIGVDTHALAVTVGCHASECHMILQLKEALACP